MSSDADILARMRDALSSVAGQYGPITDEQRNEWLGLVQEYDAAMTPTPPSDSFENAADDG